MTPDSLRKRLTLDQKVAQLTALTIPDILSFSPTNSERPLAIDASRIPTIRPHGVGHVSMAWFGGVSQSQLRSDIASVQTTVREHAPLGIGALVHFEAISGVVFRDAPQFPTAWAQAATWHPELVEAQAAVSSAFVHDVGGHLVFSPVMDLARDPRWGRVHETYGEDQELVARNAIAFVRGIHGTDTPPAVLATGKHFLGYAASEGGLNQGITALGRRALVDEYAEPFRRAISEAGLAVVMNSYNEIDGIPAAASRWLLTDLLRGELGFTGIVVSDYDAIKMLEMTYHTARTAGEAAVQSVTAGIDAELPTVDRFAALADEVRSGRVDESVIDQAVDRVLSVKQRLGLVPGFSRRPPTPLAATTDPAALGRQIADEALVLLTNDGTLPLRADTRITVLGPAADEMRIHFGAYTAAADSEMVLGSMALRAGEIPGIDPETFVFTDIFQARMPGIEPRFENAAREKHPEASTIVEALSGAASKVTYVPLGSFLDGGSALTEASVVKAVEGADVVVVAVGERTGWVGNNTAGEGQTTAEPRLPGNQEHLIGLVARTGVALVTVVVSGRPLLLSDVAARSNALVLAPLLGQHAAPALADVLLGAVNPSGKLPSTFPRSAGQFPMFHGHHYGSGYDHPTGTRHGYNDLTDSSPLFAFGHGLSYTTFAVDELSDLRCSDENLTASVEVKNTGQRAGATVVQLYARVAAAPVVRPVRQLLDFRRIELDAGESVRVQFDVPLERLAFTGVDGMRQLPEGTVTLSVGLASDDIHAAVEVDLPRR